MLDISQIALTAAILAFLAGWISVARRWARGQKLITWQPRLPVPWDLWDIALTIVALLAVMSIAWTVLLFLFNFPDRLPIEQLSLGQRASLILLESFSNLAALAISIAILFFRHRISWSDIGWVPSKCWQDTKLGAMAFLMLAPVVYGIQLVLTQWFESKHPLVELLQQQTNPGILLISVFAAVIVAPLTEEYFFRVLLQGWFERIADPLPDKPRHVPEESARQTPAAGEQLNEASGEVPPVIAQPTPSRSSAATEPADECFDAFTPFPTAHESTSEERAFVPQPAIWPVVLSSIIFALLHASHGPDWIPLLFLAVGLGYLYRQTHRIWPCIVVHFLLNALSMTLFLVQVLSNQ